MKNFYLLLLLIFASIFTYSQENTGISYQALIVDSQGESLPGFDNVNVPLSNKDVCIKFSIVNNQTNTVDYSESQSLTTNEFGIVDAIIGSGTPLSSNVWSDVEWSAIAKRLIVEVDISNGCVDYSLLSDQLLNYVPFALYAENSGNQDIVDENKELIDALTEDVNQNESDADAAIAAVQADVDQNESDSDAAEAANAAAIAATQADVDQNESDADAAIAALQADVDQNESDSDAAEAANAAAIAATQADVDQNEADADAAIAAVQADVDQNESDADAAIAAVQADVDQNESDADAAIAAVQADVDQNESDADAAIAAVQADVDQNESDADAAIAALQADVDQNESDSDAAEAANAAAIAATQADVDQNEADADAAIAALQADVDQNESDSDAAEAANAAAIAATQADVDQNEADADAAIAALQADVDQNESDSDAAEAANAAAIAATQADVDQNEADADAAIAALQADVDQNESDSDAAEAANAASIAAEIARATAAEAANAELIAGLELDDLGDATSNATSVLIGSPSTATTSAAKNNTSLGKLALDGVAAGFNNTAVGYNSLSKVTSGKYNVGIGNGAGLNIIGGSSNTFIGNNTNTLTGQAGASNRTVIGAGAIGSQNNSVVLGNNTVTQIWMSSDKGATVYAGGLNLNGTDLSSTIEELNYSSGVTSSIQNQIDNITTSVNSNDDDITTNTAAIASLQADVDQNESDSDAAEAANAAAIAATQADVDQNESDADAAIAALQADVDQNESDSDAAEAANAAAIAATQADVDQNEADADAAIAAVQADVDQNESDADAAIAALQADVDQNESDADAAIAAVQADVDQNESDADAADSANTAAIAAVQADVNKNETDSDNADATLQSAIDTKQDIITGGASTITSDNLSTNFALLSNSNGKVAVSDVTATELSYLDGVTSAIQTQINDLLNKITTLENNIATLQQLHVPVITLTGNTSVSVNQSSGSYDDAGATANDLNDGNITSSIVTVNPVDINTSGTYTVTYNVTDSDGNAAAEVTRNVTVVDDTVPVITALGNNPESIEVGSTYTDAGATAADNNDGDITSDIVTTNSVKNNIVAAYSVTYNVSDAAGNQATEVVRTVNVLDTTDPVITLTGDTSVTIEVGSTYTDAGATATDNYDGDITSSIVVVNSVNASVLGTYTVTYNVTDANGNSATEVTRTVIVVDTTKPVITVTGTNPDTVEASPSTTTTQTTRVTHTDAKVYITPSNNIINIRDDKWSLDESIDTKLHELNGTLLVNGSQQDNVLYTITGRKSAGTYIEYYVTPNPKSTGFRTNGNRSITTTYDATTTNTETEEYEDSGATASDNYDGDITSDIVTVNNVNRATFGTYTVTYNVSDSSGNNADQKTRTVNVVDTTSPVITLVGSTPLNVDLGSDYNDAGATASDSFEGNLTTSIVTVNPVNTSLAGSYTITYNVTDSSGNAAAEVTRTVNVVDATPPVITGSQNANVDENETVVGTYLANESVTWSLSGADSSKFSIDNNSGAIVFSSAPNYEAPTDSDSNNIYILTLTATDSSGNESSLNISVTVINVVEGFDSSAFSIQATTTTTTTATINWTYSGEGVEAYRLRVRIGRGGSWNPVTVFNQILPDSADLTSYTLTGLTPGTLYAFRLWPIYDGGNVCKDCNGTGEPLFTTQQENN